MNGRHIVTTDDGEYAIYQKGTGWHCRRCGNEDMRYFASYPCLNCGQDCTYCRRCLSYGRVTQCTRLTNLPTDPLPMREIAVPSMQLAPQQKWAAQRLVDSQAQSVLIHAVCGAGKTEMLYPLIAQQLAKGHYVCLAAPRVDVVLELAPRLAAQFRSVSLTVLHGQSEQKRQLSQLVVATIHQLIHYKEAFHLLIIDEVDAFPFTIDRSLQFIIEKAKRDEGRIVYVSATPNRTIRQTVDETIYVPLRYHGHVLPIPRFVWGSQWRKQLPRHCVQKIKQWLIEAKPILVFVPFVADVEIVVTQLDAHGISAYGVHATAVERYERVEQFRHHQLQVVVTTTILERGITVDNCQVIVLGSDEDTFSKAALIQIAGRVGRKVAHPTGEVLFYHDGTTVAMWSAYVSLLYANWRAKRWKR